MKKCLHCNVEFDGDRKTCPICQNALTGVDSEYNWPPIENTTRKYAFFYKLQLVLVLAACVIALSLDFLLKLNINDIHYSILVVGWGLTIEAMVKSFIRHHSFPAKIISISAVVASILLGLTAYYLNFFTHVFYIVIPAIIGATIVANFVFSFIDKAGNTLVYLLCTIIIGIIPYIALAIGHKQMLLPWTICMMVSIVAFLGIIVFKGGKVLSEVQKRFNF